MSVKQYLEEMKAIQRNILEFVEDESNIEENFENVRNNLINLHNFDDKQKFTSLLHLILNISNNHYHGNLFFSKIEKLFRLFKDKIKEYFTNSELFNIFQGNKRILLILLEEKMLVFDNSIIKKIIHTNNNYPTYFLPEIKPIINDNFNSIKDDIKDVINKKIPEDFYTKRKIGENDQYVCELVRQDLIKEFIVFVNKNNYDLNSEIQLSIYETNPLLNDKISLIEYVVFFGSIQIFNYLRMNGVKLSPSLWKYAIHGQNSEIIHILEENENTKISSCNNSLLKKLIKESIKCHHIDISNYLRNNYLTENENSESYIIDALEYYNFMLLNDKHIDESFFYYLCNFDYSFIVKNLLKEKEIDINKLYKLCSEIQDHFV